MQYIFLILAIMISACSSAPETLTISVQSSEFANEGRAFYMMVRNIDQKAYITETYQEVSGKVFQDESKSVVKIETIYPGKEAKVVVEKQTENPFAIYFLLTQPGERWKHFLPQPLPSSIQFKILDNGIQEEP